MFSRTIVGVAAVGIAGAALGYLLLLRAPDEHGDLPSGHDPRSESAAGPADQLPLSGRSAPSPETGPVAAPAASVTDQNRVTVVAPAAGDRLPGRSIDVAELEPTLAEESSAGVAGADGEADSRVGGGPPHAALLQGEAVDSGREADTQPAEARADRSGSTGEWPARGD